jgi:hypothetical protein
MIALTKTLLSCDILDRVNIYLQSYLIVKERSCCNAGMSCFFSNRSSEYSKLAGDRGFEPLLTDPESAVLPLD